MGVNVGPQGSLHGQAEHIVLVGNVCVAFLTAQRRTLEKTQHLTLKIGKVDRVDDIHLLIKHAGPYGDDMTFAYMHT